MKPLKEFQVIREKKDEVMMLRLSGPLTDYSFTDLQSALSNLMQGGMRNVVVDCDNLDYISSTAIHSLADFVKQARRANGDLILLHVPPRIRNIIAVLGFTADFKMFDKEKDALKQFEPPEPPDAKPAH